MPQVDSAAGRFDLKGYNPYGVGILPYSFLAPGS